MKLVLSNALLVYLNWLRKNFSRHIRREETSNIYIGIYKLYIYIYVCFLKRWFVVLYVKDFMAVKLLVKSLISLYIIMYIVMYKKCYLFGAILAIVIFIIGFICYKKLKGEDWGEVLGYYLIRIEMKIQGALSDINKIIEWDEKNKG